MCHFSSTMLNFLQSVTPGAALRSSEAQHHIQLVSKLHPVAFIGQLRAALLDHAECGIECSKSQVLLLI